LGPWTQTAFWLGAGSEDFGLSSSRHLAQSLRAAGAADVRFKEYPDAEHLIVVQVALDDVFLFFDGVMPK
jgi:alpha-beta hydrolase superfamily lysophospholipase